MKTSVVKLISVALLYWLSLGSVVAGEPFVISANASVIDQTKGTIEHSGDVIIDKGALHLEADRVIEYRKDGKTIRIVALGSPTVFERTKPQKNQIATVQAAKIEYLVTSNQLLLNDYSITDSAGNVQRGKQGKYLLN